MNGILLNTNADTITAELAISLENEFEIEVIYVFEKLGLLSNIDDDNSLIPFIKTSDIFSLKNDKTISGGMLPKVENIENLINNGIKKVYLCHPNQVKNLDTSHFKGTIFEK
jgi:acetylglutamate kinase